MHRHGPTPRLAGHLAKWWLALPVLLLTLALPAAAFGAATQTWVSGVGDDVNACTRTEPCKTFAGAISKTETGGEINVLDPGGFGAVTITKSITISAIGVTAGVLVSGTNGIVVSAPSTANVILRGLDFDGIAGLGLSGVVVNTAANVSIEDSSIYGFGQDGVLFQPTNTNAKLFVEGTTIHDNKGDGILAAPQSGGSGTVRLSNDDIERNACGIAATSLGVQSNFAIDCGTNASGAPVSSVQVSSIDTSASANTGAGVLSNGSAANNAIASDLITGNGVGLQEENGGTIQSLGGNYVFGNTTDGSATSSSNQNVGPPGPVGPSFVQGPAGTQGPAGARGATGQIELATCKTVTKTKKVKHKKRKVKVQQCSGKLVSSPVKFTVAATSMRATLTRAGQVYASGSARQSRSGTGLVLTSEHRLKAGSYTLALSRDRRVIGHEIVSVKGPHA